MVGFDWCDIVNSLSHVKTKTILSRAKFYGLYFQQIRISVYGT
jgi:hypothetical protein